MASHDPKLARFSRRDRGGAACLEIRSGRGALPYPSHLRGGWLAEGQSGGGHSHMDETAPTRHIVRAAHDVPPQSELRSSRPHKAGRDDKERPSLPTFKIFVVVGPAFAGRTRRKRAGTTSSREETARMSHQSWAERYVGEKGPKRLLPRLQCAISHCSKTFYGDRRLHTA